MDSYIVRKHCGRGYKYYSKGGHEIRLTKELTAYINENYIPPAYKDVHINLKKRADVYAIGTDERGRKQYLYRKKHVENSAKLKFINMVAFGKIYPSLKRDISILLGKPSKTKEHEIGMVLKLMIDCNFRIGNDVYQKENKSFGTTTIQGRHIHKTKGGGVSISFIGKKGVENTSRVKDQRIVKSLKKVRSTRKSVFSIGSTEINQYLKKYGNFTSKDIRTWQANILFIKNVCKYHNTNSKPKDTIKQASEKTAELLHHTPTISKKSYIFSELTTAYLQQQSKFYSYFSKNPEKQFICFLKKNL